MLAVTVLAPARADTEPASDGRAPGRIPKSAAAAHWAFQPVVRPPLPAVRDSAWVRNPVDAFIRAAQEARGLSPASPADRRVLIRRLTFDLTGLPPRPAEVEAFVHDDSPGAYERLVERLLASPHYGERWGRHWLDLARWAESEGYESNHLRPFAWRYRDYVVASLNANKPYDRFLAEQVAGDELTPYADENVIATGFLAAARLSTNEEDMARQRNDMLVDVVNATSSALLGLTLGCAQCHNHKFDPLTSRDYYRFQGFFLGGQILNVGLGNPEQLAAYRAALPADYEPAVKLKTALFEAARAGKTGAVRQRLPAEQLAALDTPAHRRTPAQEELARRGELALLFSVAQVEAAIPVEDRQLYSELKKKIDRLEKRLPPRPQTVAFYAPATAAAPLDVLPMKGFYPLLYRPHELARARPYLLLGGDVHRRGPALEVGWPALFGPTPQAEVARAPRVALARWLGAPSNPLTARVWVNRLWQYHFGRGIVATGNDFGTQGKPPTHPALLDWLADELVRSGWSTKHVHRLLVCSSTYRQGSARNPGNVHRDPENRFWWRWTPRRLEAEAIRDAMLAVSGELDRRAGGPSDGDSGTSRRRSLYLLQKRENPTEVQGLFDGPSASESCPRRHVSTVPLQALYLLNSGFSQKRARAFARRVVQLAGSERDRQVETAFALALGRPPDADDRILARRFFGEQPASALADVPAPLVSFCQVLLNANEFLYLE